MSTYKVEAYFVLDKLHNTNLEPYDTTSGAKTAPKILVFTGHTHIIHLHFHLRDEPNRTEPTRREEFRM